jgi:tRNA-splicing ligase RtcB
MAAAANFAWANRQAILHFAREAIEETLGLGPREHGIRLLYDLSHNNARFETHVVDRKPARLLVHRKGACRALPAGDPLLAPEFRATGQPVIIPGDMGRASYVLVGGGRSREESFATTCHGAGRRMGRNQAVKHFRGQDPFALMRERGVIVQAKGRQSVAEEMPEAYKDVSEVVEVVHRAGVSRKVARLRPVAVVKG